MPEPDNLARFIGARIKDRRLYMGRTQAELGRVLGINKEAVSRIESGENNITAVNLAKAAAFLKVNISFFCGDVVPTARESEALLCLRSMTPETFDVVLAMIKAVADK